MARTMLLFIFTLLLLAEISYCIIGGKGALRGEFPYQGVLEIKQVVGMNSTFRICGCSLIDSRWAITAGHCVKNKQASDLFLYFGRVYLYNIELQDQYPVRKIYRHPFYSELSQDHRHDIALLRIDGNLTFNSYVSQILLPVSQGNPKIEQLCTITGWGSLSEFNRTRSQELQKAEIPVVSNARCDQAYNRIFPEQICAGFEEGGVGICADDGGAPLVCTSPAGNSVLQGIGSFGRGCARPGLFNGFTRVSSFVDWIQTTTGSDEIKIDESTADDAIAATPRTAGVLALAAMVTLLIF